MRGELGAVLEGERGQGARIGFSLPISPAVEDEALRRELVGPITRATGLKSEEILKVAKYEYGSRSVVVQIPGEVDLKALKIVPRLLVSWTQGWKLTPGRAQCGHDHHAAYGSRGRWGGHGQLEGVHPRHWP